MTRIRTIARRVAPTTLLALAALATTPLAARAGVIEKNARAGETVDLDGYASDSGARSGCASTPGYVEIVVPPAGGRVHTRRERRVLGNSLDRTAAFQECISAVKNATELYYTARPNYSGRDNVTVQVTFEGGKVHEFTYVINVAARERREAPVAAPAPVARPVRDREAAPDGAAAPSPRRANASDFLSGSAKVATPAAPAAPAPAPPATAAPPASVTTAQEQPKPATPTRADAPQGMAPAEIAPPPAARAPKTPRL